MTTNTTIGWRYWWVNEPIQGRASTLPTYRLISPYADVLDIGDRPITDWPVWNRSRFKPHCRADADHIPPDAGCTCGVYASPNPLDVIFQGRWIRNAWQYQWRNGPNRQHPFPNFRLVAGRVALTSAMFQLDPADPDVTEIRAASATIKHLWICDDIPSAPKLKAELRRRYGVPVSIGHPPYTQADWGSRSKSPQWNWDWLVSTGAVIEPAGELQMGEAE